MRYTVHVVWAVRPDGGDEGALTLKMCPDMSLNEVILVVTLLAFFIGNSMRFAYVHHPDCVVRYSCCYPFTQYYVSGFILLSYSIWYAHPRHRMDGSRNMCIHYGSIYHLSGLCQLRTSRKKRDKRKKGIGFRLFILNVSCFEYEHNVPHLTTLPTGLSCFDFTTPSQWGLCFL